MAIGPTIENLRKKRAEEAALVAKIRELRPNDTLTQGPPDTVTDSITNFLAPIYEQMTGLSPRSSRYGAEDISGLMDFLPVVGGGISAAQAGRDFDQGDYGSAALNAGFSLLDMIPAVAAVRGGIRPVIAAIPEDARRLGQNVRQFLANESGAVPLPFSSSDPATERGAQIIDMLTSGRADEITDEMLDMGDPVLNANLNQYLYRNYDLPMDEASRMERAGQMGFDTGTPLYHGTDKKFQAFNSEKQRDPGFWFTTDSRNAANYADSEGDLLKVFTKTDKETQIPFNEYVLPVVNGNEVDFDDNVQLVKEYLERSGTVTFPNGNFTESGYTRVLDDPRHIRRVEARFDPRLSHLRNLSAGIAPFGLLALQPNEEQY